MSDNLLKKAILDALSGLEEKNDIVICTTNVSSIVEYIYNKIAHVVPNTGLSYKELCATRLLVLQAVSDKRFFDWEMPTLTGLTAEEFKMVANKLPRE